MRGKLLNQRNNFVVAVDHPRGCGENPHLDSGLAAEVGSPPRMRGKPLFSALGGNNSRITPADAGKTVLGVTG